MPKITTVSSVDERSYQDEFYSCLYGDNDKWKESVNVDRSTITDDSYETIATSLPRDEFPPALLRQMYFMRWGIETSFRELKYATGMTSS